MWGGSGVGAGDAIGLRHSEAGRRGGSGGGGSFTIGERSFARFEVGLALRETLSVRGLFFRRQPLLHLLFDFGVALRLGLLFSAGDDKRKCSEKREEAKRFHVFGLDR